MLFSFSFEVQVNNGFFVALINGVPWCEVRTVSKTIREKIGVTCVTHCIPLRLQGKQLSSGRVEFRSHFSRPSINTIKSTIGYHQTRDAHPDSTVPTAHASHHSTISALVGINYLGSRYFPLGITRIRHCGLGKSVTKANEIAGRVFFAMEKQQFVDWSER